MAATQEAARGEGSARRIGNMAAWGAEEEEDAFSLEPSCVPVSAPALSAAEHKVLRTSMHQACRGDEALFETLVEEWEDFQELAPSPDPDTAALDLVCVILHVGLVTGKIGLTLAPLLDRFIPAMWQHYSTQVLPYMPAHLFEFAALVAQLVEVLLRRAAVCDATRLIAKGYVHKMAGDRSAGDDRKDLRIVAATAIRLATATTHTALFARDAAATPRRPAGYAAAGEAIAAQLGVATADMDALCASMQMRPCTMRVYTFP